MELFVFGLFLGALAMTEQLKTLKAEVKVLTKRLDSSKS